ncbi:MAG TPA: hypothetical protein VGW76_15015 [Pyrinomonadaceae bacterium]|nr:hypothetical protein [Pyrinomonadaceae bacterium]
MELILRPPPAPEFHDLYCELSEALGERSAEHQKGMKGLLITPTTAKRWREKVHDHAALGPII